MRLPHLLHPQAFHKPDEPASGDSVVEETPAVAEAPEVAEDTPAATPAPTHPWSTDLEERFPDPAVRAEVDKYMLEKQAPYISKLEQERAAAQDKSWIFDALNDNPTEAIQEIAAQLWDDEKAAAIVALVNAGATAEDAEVIVDAATEETEGDRPLIDLDSLPPEVKAAIEYAEAAKARDAEAEQATQQAAADAEYADWVKMTLAANEDINEADLHAYAYAALDQEQTLEDAVKNYRAAHPAPVAEAKKAPATVGGHTTGGIQPTRPFTGLAEAMGAVYDGAAGTAA